MGRLSRNKTTNLSHNSYKSHLAQQCRLTRHVRTRNNYNLLRVIIQINIIINIRLTGRQLLLNYRMTPPLYINHIRITYIRSDILILLRHLSKRQQAVSPCHHVSINLYCWYIINQTLNQLIINLCLQHGNLFLCTKNFLLILFKLLSNISLSTNKSLLTYPCFRHFILVSISHLNIIPKHIIKANFKRRNTRLLTLALLQLQQIILT